MASSHAEGRATETILLLHAGIADSRMWRPQVEAFGAEGYEVVAPDLRGFGERVFEPEPFSHVRDVEGLLDGPSAVVGSSLGGRVALELAVLRPDLVERLVVIAPGLPGWEWSAETRAGWAEEEAAYEEGDFSAAAEAGLRMWVDGPGRSAEAVDPAMRAAVRDMILRSYELERDKGKGTSEETMIDPPVTRRLGEVRCPTLVIVGDEDVADMQAIAVHVAGSVPGARLVQVPDAAHLPSLERAEEVNALILAFLRER